MISRIRYVSVYRRAQFNVISRAKSGTRVDVGKRLVNGGRLSGRKRVGADEADKLRTEAVGVGCRSAEVRNFNSGVCGVGDQVRESERDISTLGRGHDSFEVFAVCRSSVNKALDHLGLIKSRKSQKEKNVGKLKSVLTQIKFIVTKSIIAYSNSAHWAGCRCRRIA